MKTIFPYSLLRKIIFRVSLVSIVTLVLSGLTIVLGFINDQGDHLKNGEEMSDIWIDMILSESFEHVYWVFILSFIIVTISIYFIVKNALKDVNAISSKVDQIDINNPETYNQEFVGPKEIRPLLNSLKDSYEKIQTDFRQQKEFIQNASHELNTPIAILRANIESLKDSADKQALMKDLELLEQISAQLLRLSQAENFKVRKDETADLIQVIDFAIETAAHTNDANIVFEPNMDSFKIKGNKEYLYMCFRNLIENAILNSAKGSKIQIGCEKDKVFIRNEKQDPNLKQEDAEKLFQKFWRFDKNKYQGSGLGLNIVKRIIDAHDASVEIKIDDKFFTVFIGFLEKSATNTVH